MLSPIALLLLFSSDDLPRVTTHAFNVWSTYSGDHAIGGNWSVRLEASLRRSDGLADWQQSRFRTHLNHNPNSNWQFSFGYVFGKTYPYGGFPARQAFDEHRIEHQVTVRKALGEIRLQGRMRLEQRWVDVQKNVASGPLPHDFFRMQQRARVQLRVEFPLRGKWFVPVYEEILLHVPPNVPARAFDQNRISGGVGQRYNDYWRVEMLYMNQFIARRNGRIHESNHTLMLSVFSTQPFRRKK